MSEEIVTTEVTENSGTDNIQSQAVPQDNGQTPVSQDTPQADGYNPKWYEQDGRWGKMWKSPDDIIKSYSHLEKQYKPLAEQVKTYNSTFKELGIEPQKLPEIYKEYQTLKDPSNPINQKASYLDNWLKDPVYSTKVDAFFQDLEAAKLQEMYPGMNREQIEKQVAMEQELKAIREKEQQKQDEEYLNTFTAQLNQQVERNKKLADSVGFVYNTEVHKAVMDAVAKHDQEHGYPMTAYEAFLQLYGEQIETARAQKLEAEILARQSKKGNSGIPVKTGKPAQTNQSLTDKFRAILSTNK